MADRAAEIATFLAGAGWGDAEIRPLAGDASNRRYLRLRDSDGTPAVLMDAPAERGEDTRPFLRMAEYLAETGLSAPGVLARDVERGLVLLEDLGDDLYARVITADPLKERPLYETAADLLAHLHRAAPPSPVKHYDATEMVARASLAFDWYRKGATGDGGESARGEVRARLADALDALAPEEPRIALLDYHAENLLWLPERDGVARVGLLDFQDAMLAHPAYDLMSLVTDARRDVMPSVRARTTTRFIEATGRAADPFEQAVATLSVQRNLRIVGVFARLALRDGKPGYLALIPRVWGYLVRDLDHPALSALKEAVLTGLPAPRPAILDRLKAECRARHP